MTIAAMDKAAAEAGGIIWRHWEARTRIDALPAACRPIDRRSGYAAQAALATASGDRVIGWKIAATSAAGQHHIGVDGPLAGRLLAARVVESGWRVPLMGNLMRVAEAEFVFRMGKSLPQRAMPYSMDDVLAAIGSIFPGIEVPDSRFNDFARAGMPSLIADNACTDWFVLGPEVTAPWRHRDLAAHEVIVNRNGAQAAVGKGSMVLGSPLSAMLWIANELREYGQGLAQGDLVTTGTCIVPLAINEGERISAEFGEFGQVSAVF
ncbi:MAG: fumarylacetoacetate hydrolase family protein [Burkholderiales bacterium]